MMTDKFLRLGIGSSMIRPDPRDYLDVARVQACFLVCCISQREGKEHICVVLQVHDSHLIVEFLRFIRHGNSWIDPVHKNVELH